MPYSTTSAVKSHKFRLAIVIWVLLFSWGCPRPKDLPGSSEEEALSPEAQLQTEEEAMPTCWFGISVAGVGDLDGDHVEDFAIGSPCERLQGEPGKEGERTIGGSVRIYSGGTGHLMRTLRGEGWFGLYLNSPGDVNGDDVSDLAVLAGVGDLSVYSGSTGRLIWKKSAGELGFERTVGARHFDGGEDLDGDGIGDLLVGITRFPASQDDRFIQLLSGKTGDRLGAMPRSSFEGSAALVGDWTGDGISEIAIPEISPDRVRIIVASGHSLEEVKTIILPYERIQPLEFVQAYSPGSSAPIARCTIARMRDPASQHITGLAVGVTTEGRTPGRVFIIHKPDGTILHELSRDDEVNHMFGYALCDAGDLNGDGTADLLVGCYCGSGMNVDNHGRFVGGEILAFSGATGDLVFQRNNPTPLGVNPSGIHFGVSVLGIGDIDRDFVPDAFIGSSPDLAGDWDPGAGYVISGSSGTIVYTLP